MSEPVALVVDSRETRLAALLGSAPNVTVRPLDVGDVLLLHCGTPVLVIERKSLQDLFASIKDGRYREQARRLHSSGVPAHHVVYLLEGSFSSLPAVARPTVYSAIFSLNYFQGFSLWWAPDVERSAELLTHFASKLARRPGRRPFHGDTVPSLPQYAEVAVVQKKNANITPQNVGIFMLSQVPGVSHRTAEVLLAKFQNIGSLLDALRRDPSCLEGLQFANGRRVSARACRNVFTFLVADTPGLPDGEAVGAGASPSVFQVDGLPGAEEAC